MYQNANVNVTLRMSKQMSPSLLMFGWKQWLRKTTTGALKGYFGEKVSNSLNLSPSKTVSLGPVIVAIHLLVESNCESSLQTGQCHTWKGCRRREKQWLSYQIGWRTPSALSASVWWQPFGPSDTSWPHSTTLMTLPSPLQLT